MIVMLEMQVAIVEIVGMAFVRYSLMPAGRTVHVTMASVFLACSFHGIHLHVIRSH